MPEDILEPSIAERTAGMNPKERNEFFESVTAKNHYIPTAKEQPGAEIGANFIKDPEKAQQIAEIEKSFREATPEENQTRIGELVTSLTAKAAESYNAKSGVIQDLETPRPGGGHRFPGEVQEFYSKRTEKGLKRANEGLEAGRVLFEKYGLDIANPDQIVERIKSEYPSETGKEIYNLLNGLWSKLNGLKEVVDTEDGEASKEYADYAVLISEIGGASRDISVYLRENKMTKYETRY